MERLLKLAKEDFEIAQLLYNEKKYSNALYHYHQSVEKTVKYIGLSTGMISEVQLIKNISHNPINAFRILFKVISEQYNGLLPPVDSNIFDKAKNIIESKSEDYLVMQVIDNIKALCNEKKIIDEDQYPSQIDALTDYVSKMVPSMVNVYKIENEIEKKYVATRLKSEINNTIIFINYGIKILQILLMHSLICSKYKPDLFRYASPQIGNPVEYFNEQNPIILGLPFLIETMNIPITFASDINWNNSQ
jgi:hypothetical protein